MDPLLLSIILLLSLSQKTRPTDTLSPTETVGDGVSAGWDEVSHQAKVVYDTTGKDIKVLGEKKT